MVIQDKDLLGLQNEGEDKENLSEFDKMFEDVISEEDNSQEEQNNEQEEKGQTQEEEQQPMEDEQTEERETSEEQPNEEQGGEKIQGGEEKQAETQQEQSDNNTVDDDITSVVEELLNEAEKLGGEEVDKAAQEVQDAIEGGNKDEILDKIVELEDALNKEILEKEGYKKEKEMLLSKLNDLQDKLSEYEIRGYEYGNIEKALEEDPQLKGFVKILAYAKTNPDKVGKEKLIDALDGFVQSEFGVGIKDLLSEKANNENKKMTMGEEKQPIEITLKEDDKDPIDKMLGI